MAKKTLKIEIIDEEGNATKSVTVKHGWMVDAVEESLDNISSGGNPATAYQDLNQIHYAFLAADEWIRMRLDDEEKESVAA